MTQLSSLERRTAGLGPVPRGVDACLRPGRPSPLDQTRLPTPNLALSRFSPTGEQFRLISSEPSITKRRGFFATHSEALSSSRRQIRTAVSYRVIAVDYSENGRFGKQNGLDLDQLGPLGTRPLFPLIFLQFMPASWNLDL